MADFDKAEWMENEGLRYGDWQQMKVKPISVYIDVRLKGGKETGPCWPLNSGVFVDLSTEKEIKTSDIIAIRFYMDVDPETEGLESDDDDEVEAAEAYERQRHHVDSVED